MHMCMLCTRAAHAHDMHMYMHMCMHMYMCMCMHMCMCMYVKKKTYHGLYRLRNVTHV